MTAQTKARCNMRNALAGASAIVVIALVLGADLKAARPVVRDCQGDTLVERTAVRHLTASLARAMWDLVGTQQQPAIHAWLGLDLGPPGSLGIWPRSAADDAAGMIVLLRPSLLDLPPPTIG